jgi:phage-related protein
MAPSKTRVAKKPMTQAHKAKLAEGRTQSRTINAYLQALESNRPRRGRRVDTSPQRLAQLDKEIEEAFGIRKLELVQQKIELESLASSDQGGSDLEELRKAFVRVAKSYGQRKGISYTAWRQVGVPAEALREAGIGR